MFRSFAIYEPSDDSYLLLEQVKKHAFGKVLDLGAGSGILAEEAVKLKKVSSVLAADVSDEVFDYLKNKIKKEKSKGAHRPNFSKKIKIIKSDLFSNIKGRFDTIIFNPPYLPLDKREPLDSQLATTGGKHGYETLRRFILDLNDHLTKDGIALIVFSSLTNKDKIDEFIKDAGFEFELLKEEKITFEKLYCYKIKRSWSLDELFKKKITNIKLLMKGHRGIIFTGNYKNKKIAVKAQRKDIAAKGTVNREAGIIAKLNKKGIAPKLLFKGNDYFAYEYVHGNFIIDFLEKSRKNETKKVLLEVLRQCRILDKLKITKEEMTNPYKHVIINKKIVLIDFERAHYSLKPHNVTQFCQYIMRNALLLGKKGIKLSKGELIQLSRNYKNSLNEQSFRKITNLFK